MEVFIGLVLFCVVGLLVLLCGSLWWSDGPRRQLNKTRRKGLESNVKHEPRGAKE